MNRLPPTLPGRWLDEVLPGGPSAHSAPLPAWRFATAAAVRPPPPAPVPQRQAGVLGKPAAPSQAEQARLVRAAPNPVREQPADDREAWCASQDGSAGGQGGGNGGNGGDESGQGDAGPEVSCAAPASEDAFDAQDIVALLPAGECSGIFEVQLPGGEMMAVAVDAGPAAVAYHLKPAGKGLAERLRGRQKELSAHLERRIGKEVTLTIL